MKKIELVTISMEDLRERDERFIDRLEAYFERETGIPTRWHSQRGVADMTGLSDHAIRKATDSGELSVYRVGRVTRYLERDVISWMETKRPKALLANYKAGK